MSKLSRLVTYDVFKGSKISILVRQQNKNERQDVYCIRLRSDQCHLGSRHYVCRKTLLKLFEMKKMTMATAETEEVLEQPDSYCYIQ
jgi:hypothetical protein